MEVDSNAITVSIEFLNFQGANKEREVITDAGKKESC